MNCKYNDLLSEKLKKSLTDLNTFVSDLGENYQRIANVEVEISSNTPRRSFAEEADTSELDKEMDRIRREMENVCSKAYKEDLPGEEREKINWKLQDLETELSKVRNQKNRLLEASVLLLGEYIRRKPNDVPKIVLYINSIIAAGGNTQWLIVQVYAHEMMHAYFDFDTSKPNMYTSFVEEPITELGMLYLMKKYDSRVPGIFDDALSNVKKKQSVVGCMHYGFGAYLYEHELPVEYWIGIMHDGKYNVLDATLLEQYKKTFAQGKYPTNEQQHADWLEELLDKHAKRKTVAECDSAISVYEDEGMSIPSALNRRRKRCEEREKRGVSSTAPTMAPANPIYTLLKSKTDKSGNLWYSDGLQKCIEETVDKLLHPAKGFKQQDPGLLLGKIQSGKTRAFVGIIGLMFDKGVDIAIVLTKGTKALAQQTKTRMEDEFSAFASRRVLGRPVIEVFDILNKRSGFSVRELNNKNIIICKKEKNNLTILNNIAHLNGFDQKKILIVDDEADFASRNYKNKGGTTDLAAIATSIDGLVASLNDCYYLQVTATPYSLYLQPDGCLNLSGGGTAMPFKPRFTCLLPIYPGYVGGKQYFTDSLNGNSMYSHLFMPVREQCRDAISRIDRRYINNVTTSPNLIELRQAVMGYFMATAIRRIQENNREDYLSSCIVHVEIAKTKHDWEGQLIIKLTEEWENDIRSNNGILPSSLDPMIDILYDDYEKSITKGVSSAELPNNVKMPPKPDVRVEMASLFLNKDYRIEVINSDQDVPALLDRNGQLKLTHAVNIFVGGQILDRGITISNLLCFFYGRNPRTLQQDTVLQHSRMYGNRSKEDMAVTRFYTTVRLHTLLAEIDELDEQLRQWLIKYSTTQGFDPAMAVVFSDSKTLKPCSGGKIAMSECIALRAGRRLVHAGFQTDCQTNIKPIVDDIDQIIRSQPNYSNKDSDGIFEVDTKVVVDLLHKVRSTYIYNRTIDNNEGLDWNVQEMIGAIQYATTNTNGKMWLMHKTNRNMSRVRQNGGFIDAPDDGRTDLEPARAKAVNKPIIMFIKENGNKNDGWRDAPFYWPVLVLQQKLDTAFYTSSQNAK